MHGQAGREGCLSAERTVGGIKEECGWTGLNGLVAGATLPTTNQVGNEHKDD